MTDTRFPVKRINIVEEETWKKNWDPADKIMGYASDHAYEAFSQMSVDDVERYVGDLATARDSKGRKPRRKFSPSEIRWTSEQVKDGNKLVENTHYAIVDALTWMYEAAYMPNKGDIEHAMDQAKESVTNNFSLNLHLWEPVLLLNQQRRGPKEWSPRKRIEGGGIVMDLLKHVDFEQAENHYDRFLVFDFRSSQAVKDLLSRYQGAEAALVYALRSELDAIQRDYVIDFFDALEKTMEELDIENRANWRAAWRSMLDSGNAPDAQKEMAAAIKEMPEGYDDA